MLAVDQKIETLNRKLQSSFDSLLKAQHNILEHIQSNMAGYDISAQLIRLGKTADKALELHTRLAEEGQELEGAGTGNVSLLHFDLNI